MISSLFFPVFFALLTASQSPTDNTTFQIAAIQAHFSGSGIVPSLLQIFQPSALLSLSYTGVGPISPGQSLSRMQAQPAPSVAVVPANPSVQLNGNYTLVMVDAGPVGSDESKGQRRHWLVNDVTVSGTSINTQEGTAVTRYAGPAPPPGSGPHRYVTLMYKQPDNFAPPAEYSKPNSGVVIFSLADYVQSCGMGSPVAGTYMTTEEGTATFTPSPTTPVQSSTILAAQTSKVTYAASTTRSSAVATLKTNSALAMNDGPFGWLLAFILSLFAL